MIPILDKFVAGLVAIVVAGSMMLDGCRDPVTPTTDADAVAPPPPDLDGMTPGTSCTFACARLGALGCPEAHPAVGTCEDTCERNLDAGTSLLDPECIAAAKTAADARKCNVRCQGQP